MVAKYYTKADHGFWHSYAFTTGDFQEPIRMKARSQAVTESACRVCHLTIVQAIDTPHGGNERLSCIHCHHGARIDVDAAVPTPSTIACN
jgi:cytochrome c nitrite reductase small subunit